MTIILSHNSALEHFRSAVFTPEMLALSINPESKHPMTSAEAVDIADQRLGVSTPPFHILVGSGQARSRHADIVNHVCSRKLPRGSFYSIKKGYSVSCPELCFLQMAQILPPVKLIELGFELCGNYAIDSTDMRGFAAREPLTKMTALERYCRKVGAFKGVKAARQALPHIIDNAASPMETKLVMLLCLPASYGGFALPQPKMNYPISASDISAYKGKRQYFCDLFWPESKLAVEYDSDMFHVGSDRIAYDAERRRNLIAKGITVISVTKDQVFNANKTEALARMLASKMGHRIRTSLKDAMMRRYDLRKALFQTE